MKAYQCDKCKKPILNKDLSELTLSGYVVCESGIGIGGTELEQNIYDICPDCVKLLDDFLKERKI